MCKGPWPPGVPSEEVAEQHGARNQGTVLAGAFKCSFVNGRKFRGHRDGRHGLFPRDSERLGQGDQNPAVAVRVIGLQGRPAPGARGREGGGVCIPPGATFPVAPVETPSEGVSRVCGGAGEERHRAETQTGRSGQSRPAACGEGRVRCAQGCSVGARGRVGLDVAERTGRTSGSRAPR